MFIILYDGWSIAVRSRLNSKRANNVSLTIMLLFPKKYITFIWKNIILTIIYKKNLNRSGKWGAVMFLANWESVPKYFLRRIRIWSQNSYTTLGFWDILI